MENFVAMVLGKIDGDLTRLGEVFGETLTHQEELMLNQIDAEMGMRVEGILDMVLAGTPYSGEIALAQSQRDHVMELTAIRRAIHELVRERGTLRPWKESLN